MRSISGTRRALNLSFLAVALSALPALAQQSGAPPATTTCPAAVAEIATCYSEKLGSGAYVLAAMPKDWDGNLIVFGHGGPALVPPTAASSQGDLARYSFMVRRGHAW